MATTDPYLHYLDTSQPVDRAAGLAPTWCEKRVPASQTTTIRSVVTCQDCRRAAHIRGHRDHKEHPMSDTVIQAARRYANGSGEPPDRLDLAEALVLVADRLTDLEAELARLRPVYEGAKVWEATLERDAGPLKDALRNARRR